MAYPFLPAPLRRAGRAAVAFAAGLSGLGTAISVRTRERAVALTFDDGPHPEDTPAMLDVLGEVGARGTFFLVGQRVRRHPEIVERLVREGHAVGNHTWGHLPVSLLKGRYRRAQVRWTAEALAPWQSAQPGPRLFRPPHGAMSLAARLDLAALGHLPVCWDAAAEDWLALPAEEMARRARRRLGPGSILLWHDTLWSTADPAAADRAPARAAVRLLVGELGSDWRFVTVPELLALGSTVRWPWFRRAHLDWQHRIL